MSAPVSVSVPVPGPVPAAPPTLVRTLIVGGGLCGVRTLHAILSSDRSASVLLLERGSSLGGVWHWNRYPGARCDVPSYSYSYEGDEELGREFRWTEKYGRQADIHRYINQAADKWAVREHVRLRTSMAKCEWDAAVGRWLVVTRAATDAFQAADVHEPIVDERTYSAQFVIMATGTLSLPLRPQLPGSDTFLGRQMQTSSWPHDLDIDWSQMRVGVVGTGSSGVQVAPELAAQSKHLTLFQRTANYVLPSSHEVYDDATIASKQKNHLANLQACKLTPFGMDLQADPRPYADIPAEEMRASLQARWKQGGFGFYNVCSDLLTNEASNRAVADFVREQIRAQVTDPVTADLLCPPTSLFMGCKRPPLSDSYYPMFNRPNVTLVPVGANPIVRVLPTGVELADGSVHELDVLVWATGFDSLVGPLVRGVDITGAGGVKLRDHFKEGPRTYLGLQTPGFPNLFIMSGVQSPSVFSNNLPSLETHAVFVAQLLTDMEAKGRQVVEAAPEAAAAWTGLVDLISNMTLYGTSAVPCNSWYLGSNVAANARAHYVFLGGVNMYNAKLAEVQARDYEGFIMH